MKKRVYKPLTKEELIEHTGDDGAQVYCSTYYKYNDGDLYGAWVDLESFDNKEDLFVFLHRLHADERDPEFMFQDYKYFPSKFYCESGCDFEGIFEWLELDEDDREMTEEYWNEVSEEAEISDILDAFVYKGNPNNYFDELADEMLDNANLPESIKFYFDYEKWERDCAADYYVTNHYVFSA